MISWRIVVCFLCLWVSTSLSDNSAEFLSYGMSQSLIQPMATAVNEEKTAFNDSKHTASTPTDIPVTEEELVQSKGNQTAGKLNYTIFTAQDDVEGNEIKLNPRLESVGANMRLTSSDITFIIMVPMLMVLLLGCWLWRPQTKEYNEKQQLLREFGDYRFSDDSDNEEVLFVRKT